MASITITFFLCWTPVVVFNIMFDFYRELLPERDSYAGVGYALSLLCGLMTSVANPILYSSLNENFRKAVKDFFHGVFKKAERSPGGGGVRPTPVTTIVDVVGTTKSEGNGFRSRTGTGQMEKVLVVEKSNKGNTKGNTNGNGEETTSLLLAQKVANGVAVVDPDCLEATL